MDCYVVVFLLLNRNKIEDDVKWITFSNVFMWKTPNTK